MKRTCIALVPTLVVAASLAWAQQPSPASRWEAWQSLIGFWVGEGGPGRGISQFSFLPDLQGKILVRKNHAEYPASQDRPAAVHDDLLIVYGDTDADRQAVYFDNEGHVIEYAVSVSADRKTIIFVSPAAAGAPRYRLSFFEQDRDRFRITFEIAPPGKPEAFATYVAGFARRRA
jgi:hypothetical protein